MRSLAAMIAVLFAVACDGASPQCQWGGAPGVRLSASACTAIADHTAEPSSACTTGQSCCIETPSVARTRPRHAHEAVGRVADERFDSRALPSLLHDQP